MHRLRVISKIYVRIYPSNKMTPTHKPAIIISTTKNLILFLSIILMSLLRIAIKMSKPKGDAYKMISIVLYSISGIPIRAALASIEYTYRGPW